MISPRVQLAVAVVAGSAVVLCSAVLAGEEGLKGALLGLGASTFNLLAMWWIIRVGTIAFQGGDPPRRVTAFAAAAFLAKIPVFVACGLIAQRMGGQALNCFLIGLGVVYLALVGWSLAKR